MKKNPVFIGLLAVLAIVSVTMAQTSTDQTITTQQYGSTTQSQSGMSSSPPAADGSGPTAAPPASGYSRPGESPGAGAGTGLSGSAPGSTMSSPDQSSTYRSYSSDTTTTRRYGATEPTPHGVTPGPLPRSEEGSGPTAAPPAWGYSRPGESAGQGAGTGLWSRDQQMGTSTAPGATMSSPDQSSTYRSYRSESSTSTVPPSAAPSQTYESSSSTMSSTTPMDTTRMRSYGVDGSGVTASPPAWGYSRPGESPGPGAGTGLGSTATAPPPAPTAPAQ